jgi:hypothetical protein
MTTAMLPRLSFPVIGAPGSISLNQGTMAAVVFVPHREPCEECTRYLEVLGAAAGGLREWATRAVVLVSGSDPGPVVSGVALLDDGSGIGRRQLGIGDDQAAVLQADRWGAVYQSELVGPNPADHTRLSPSHDLVAMSKFIDIQCPECEVPSKEWLAASPFPLG